MHAVSILLSPSSSLLSSSSLSWLLLLSSCLAPPYSGSGIDVAAGCVSSNIIHVTWVVLAASLDPNWIRDGESTRLCSGIGWSSEPWATPTRIKRGAGGAQRPHDQCWLRGLKEFSEAREDSGNGRPAANEIAAPPEKNQRKESARRSLPPNVLRPGIASPARKINKVKNTYLHTSSGLGWNHQTTHRIWYLLLSTMYTRARFKPISLHKH